MRDIVYHSPALYMTGSETGALFCAFKNDEGKNGMKGLRG